jgi:hypothetical protein
MATPEEIANQQELLHAHRRTLHHCLRQQAALGVLTPPGVVACIDEARDHIYRIKAVLRTWGIEVDDAPDDEPPTISSDDKASTSALEVSQALTQAYHQKYQSVAVEQPIDAWGMVSMKSRLHTLSESAADEAAHLAAIAAEHSSHDVLARFAPLIVYLRWKRGYASGLQYLLKIPKPRRWLKSFKYQPVDPPCTVEQGVLSAEPAGPNQVLVLVDGQRAALVTELEDDDVQVVLDAVNRHGILGITAHPQPLLDRIGEVALPASKDDTDSIAELLYRNRAALIPLIAWLGMPGDNWLLPQEEAFPLLTEEPLLDEESLLLALLTDVEPHS